MGDVYLLENDIENILLNLQIVDRSHDSLYEIAKLIIVAADADRKPIVGGCNRI